MPIAKKHEKSPNLYFPNLEHKHANKSTTLTNQVTAICGNICICIMCYHLCFCGSENIIQNHGMFSQKSYCFPKSRIVFAHTKNAQNEIIILYYSSLCIYQVILMLSRYSTFIIEVRFYNTL